jgi:hypothetical protein
MAVKLNTSAKFSRTEAHRDWYDWAVYVDEDEGKLDEIEQVTYFLDQTFPDPVRTITIADKSSGFAIRNRGWGQLDVKARISYKDGHSEQIAYRINLPEVKQATGNLRVNIFDGTRQPVSAGTQILLRVIDGNQKQIVNQFYSTPSILVQGLPTYNNFGDSHTVLVSAYGYNDTGFTPIKVSPRTVQTIDLMLLPHNPTFNFRDALWPTLKQTHPNFAALLAQGAADDNAAQDRYTQLMENQPRSLASFFNLATAMSAINLPVGTPLDYIKEVIWDNTFEQDRFFGYADPQIIDQIITATGQGEFAPEIAPSIFHSTATRSWKQIQFGEANVQLTFHENDPTKQIGGINCVKVEVSVDYYRDLAAHFLLEVVVNGLTHSLTNPKQVYVLRWMAGRHAGLPDFNPPYVIV